MLLEMLSDMNEAELAGEAETLTLQGWARDVSYSRKVFIALTHLCRDVCHYCTFAKAPRSLRALYLTLEQCVTVARQGVAAGCKEALFTLGDQPEHRYPAVRRWLDDHADDSTLDYLFAAAKRRVFAPALTIWAAR